MSTAPALARIVLLVNCRRDPRRYRRYPVSLNVTYKLFHNSRIERLGVAKLSTSAAAALVLNAAIRFRPPASSS